MTETTWPAEPNGIDPARAAELLFTAQLDRAKAEAAADRTDTLEQHKGEIAARQAEADADVALAKAQDDARLASITAFHTALIDVAKGTIDRARASAELVQKAAAAIATLYTGVLALAFSVAERPLPSRGLVPAVLLGWAIVWATVYLAYLSKPKSVDAPTATSDFAEGAMRRSSAFILWTRSGAMNRGYALRVSVIALALGLVLLPAPFVVLGGTTGSDATDLAKVAPAWPEPDAATTDPELARILYAAQVTEAARARADASKPIADDGNDSIWWWLCGAGLLLSLLVPLVVGAVTKPGDPPTPPTPTPEGELPGPAMAA
jgi:hypothetical protein